MKFQISKYKTIFYFFSLFFNHILNAESAKIVSGPILGYSTLKEVLVWVQTDQKSNVKLEYSEIGNSKNKLFSEEIQTKLEQGFIAKLIANQVEPGKKYNYNILIDGKKIPAKHSQVFQTQPFFTYASNEDPPSFSFALGSCSYINEPEFEVPGKTYGGEYFIFNSILSKKPNFYALVRGQHLFERTRLGFKNWVFSSLQTTKGNSRTCPSFCIGSSLRNLG